jgi:predicted RNA-binding protein YlxR (DUF448 family)
VRRDRRSPKPSIERSPVAQAGSRRHVAVRTCAGCGERSAQKAMHRMTLDGEAGLTWRETGGRGAYLHPRNECRDRFVSGKRRVPGLRAAIGRDARLRLVEKWLVLS